MMWVELRGASYDDSSGEREYKDCGKVLVNPRYVTSAYDHTVKMVDGNKIRVMERIDEIEKKLTGGKK